MKRILVIWPNVHNVWEGYFEVLEKLGATFYLTRKRANLKKPNNYIFTDDMSLKEVLSKVKPDCIIIYHLFNVTTWKLILRRYRVVVLESMHLLPTAWKESPNKLLQLLFQCGKPIVRFMWNRFRGKSKMLCMTKRSLSFMQGFEGTTYACIPYKFFYPEVQRHIRSKFTMLFVGRFVEMKRLSSVISTVKEMVRRGTLNNDFELVLVGGGGDKEKEILKAINKIHHISFVGKIKHAELKKYYSESDVLILPSYDVLGAVTLEAIETELPVLISENSGFSRLVPRTMVFNNKEQLRRKILWCIKNREKLPGIARETRKQFVAQEKAGREKLKLIVTNT